MLAGLMLAGLMLAGLMLAGLMLAGRTTAIGCSRIAGKCYLNPCSRI
jgi:hypothetical protein